jgi:hypothetical protein
MNVPEPLTLDALVKAMARDACCPDRPCDAEANPRLGYCSAHLFSQSSHAALAAMLARATLSRDDLLFLARRADDAEETRAGGPHGEAAFRNISALLRALADVAP